MRPAEEAASCRRRQYVTVAVLFFINLLNYMDRFTIAGVLTELQSYFRIGDWESGLLQTVFISTYMVFAPLFGYIGDRYPRKFIILVGIIIWSGSVLCSSFVPSGHFWLFVFLRAVVGIGEASYSTVAPTIIGDLFMKNQRSRVLMFFYFAVPLGSGLGFIVGSNVAMLASNQWQWGVRVTPVLGIVCVFLVIFILEEPRRGEVERATHLQSSQWSDDLRYISHKKTYLFSTLGFTAAAFTIGTLSWWTPNFFIYCDRMHGVLDSAAKVNLIFGVITCTAGFAGVIFGSSMAQIWRITNPRADSLVCGFGLIAVVPFLYVAINMIQISQSAAYPLVFVTVSLLCLNWAVLSDILLSVIAPNRRSTASAFQILCSHLLGDAISPYIIGQISDSIRGSDEGDAIRFQSLKLALYTTPFAAVLGGFFFLASAWYIERDKYMLQLELKGMSKESAPAVSVTETSSNLPYAVMRIPSTPSNANLVTSDITPDDVIDYSDSDNSACNEGSGDESGPVNERL